MVGNKTVLVVDDEQRTRRLLGDLFRQAGFHCATSPDAGQALQVLKRRNIPLVIADIRMPGKDGIALLREIRDKHPDVCVILLAEPSTIEKAIAAMKAGAYDYATKPKGLYRLPILAERAFEHMDMKRQLNHIQADMQARYHLDNFISESEIMQRIHEMVRQAAQSETVIMIQGESGTGKDLLAHIIHHNSSRSQGPFIKVECGALPETLMEQELFGYEREHFRGGAERKAGYLELAEGGTLYLDEVTHLSPLLQKRILHVVENGEFKRLSGTAPLRFDARIMAATTSNLDEAAQATYGAPYSQALFPLFEIVTIELPPLRSRVQDIPLLSDHFLDIFCARLKCPVKRIFPEAVHLLMDYYWPGNVRELKQAIEYAVTISRTEMIEPADLCPHILPAMARLPDTFNLGESEKLLLTQALKTTGGNIKQAATLLGISRTTLYSKIRKHRLPDPCAKGRRQ